MQSKIKTATGSPKRVGELVFGEGGIVIGQCVEATGPDGTCVVVMQGPAPYGVPMCSVAPSNHALGALKPITVKLSAVSSAFDSAASYAKQAADALGTTFKGITVSMGLDMGTGVEPMTSPSSRTGMWFIVDEVQRMHSDGELVDMILPPDAMAVNGQTQAVTANIVRQVTDYVCTSDGIKIRVVERRTYDPQHDLMDVQRETVEIKGTELTPAGPQERHVIFQRGHDQPTGQWPLPPDPATGMPPEPWWASEQSKSKERGWAVGRDKKQAAEPAAAIDRRQRQIDLED